MPQSRNVLVTGGMGFIGTAVVKRFARTDKVTVADRLFFGISPEVAPLVESGKVEFVNTDLAEISDLHRRIAQGEFGVIVHLASLTHIPLCEQYPDFAYRANVISCLNIVSRLPAGCRFLNFSTSSTYTPGMSLHAEDDAALVPCDFYGWTKKHAEDLAGYYARRKGMSVLNVRLANAAGYGETNPKLLGTIFEQIRSGAAEVTLGNLSPRRDFIHIDDIAWAVYQLIRVWPVQSPGLETFNIGTGYPPVSVAEVFEKIADCCPRKVTLRSVAEKCRATDRQLLAVEVKKLKAALPEFAPQRMENWLPQLVRDPGIRISNNLEKIIDEYYRCHRA